VRASFHLAVLLALAGCGGGTEAVAGGPPGLAEDDRVAYLLEPCARDFHYDVNTADVEGILLETLQHGLRDPLQRSRVELAELGAPGIELLTRVVREHWSDAGGKNHVRNALDSATLSDDPAARDLLLEALGFPFEDVRMVAVRGLSKHGRAEDWEALHAILPGVSGAFLLELIQVMHALDKTPTQALVLDWVEAGELVPLLADTSDPELLARCAALWPKLGKVNRVPLATACAAAGDEEALAQVRAWRDDPADSTLRRVTLIALARAGLFDELLPALRGDGLPENRIIVLGHLTATTERTHRYHDAVAAALSDADPGVARTAAEALARIGDPAAVDRALAELAGDGPPQEAMEVLRWAFAAAPPVAERAHEVLEERLARESHRALSQRVPLLSALGQVPLERAAELLLELSDDAEGVIQGQPARRWLTVQAGNTGDAAHPELLERLAAEPDPARRVDYLDALSTRGGASAREALLEFVQSERATPYEILFAASRLVRIGPTAQVAPVLKRATLRVSQDDVRRALQCLLWMWYPGPR